MKQHRLQSFFLFAALTIFSLHLISFAAAAESAFYVSPDGDLSLIHI